MRKNYTKVVLEWRNLQENGDPTCAATGHIYNMA